jgi:hypothetical protein
MKAKSSLAHRTALTSAVVTQDGRKTNLLVRLVLHKMRSVISMACSLLIFALGSDGERKHG